jgi:DNA-binding SARP family transcriptional activator
MMSCLRLADLYWTKGDFSKMRIYLKKTIRIAKQKQYDGILIGEANKNPKFFELAKEENIESDYLSKLMKKIGHKRYLEVWTLGDFRVKINGNDVSQGKWKNERARSVFTYFLTKRTQVIGRDQLLNVFFPDVALQKASHRLRMSLLFIRKMFGERGFILYENRSYRINPKVKCWIDVDEFLQTVETGDKYIKDGKNAEAIKYYLRAVALYKGDYLKDLYDNWCEKPREYYHSIYIKILKHLAEYSYNQNSYEDSIRYYQKIIEKDRFTEEAYCGVMRNYAKVGNRKEVVRQFNKLTEILREELECEPLSETKKLYKLLIKHNCK